MSQHQWTLLTVIGARPQWMKASALSRCLAQPHSLFSERILHTGQHYSHNMSGAFFKELGLPQADHQLEVSTDPGIRMGQMMQGITDAIHRDRPDAVILYGDTDSTLAGAWAATRCGVPAVHIEAGLRSFDRAMPEEINRILTDELSSLLFCPSKAAVEQLQREGIFTGSRPGVRVEISGDLMLDTARHFGGMPVQTADPTQRVLLTLHRPSNVDDPERLNRWIDALASSASKKGWTIVFPVHPRTEKGFIALFGSNWQAQLESRGFEIHPPAGYLQMLQWLKSVDCVFTDSGGLQKEAFFMHRPAVILRTTTEWVELLDGGYAELCEDPEMLESVLSRQKLEPSLDWNVPVYGDGNAADEIAKSLEAWLKG